MRPQKKCRGYMLLSAVLSSIIFMLLAGAYIGLYGGQFSKLQAANTALEAQRYAEIVVNTLTLTPYDELADKGKQLIDGSDSWQEEVSIGPEKTIGGQNKQRIATVKIYRVGEVLPRYSLQVPFSSAGSTGVPIGSVIAWPLLSDPSGPERGKWLECNGQAVNPGLYPKLAALMSHTPNYYDVFLEGASQPGIKKEAGLPNITGMVGYWNDSFGTAQSGALYLQYAYAKGQASGGGYSYSIHFDASRSNAVYGRSHTVQPPAMTVRYLIKAK